MSAKKTTALQKTRTRLVRVVPFNERLGYLARNITWRGRKFTNQWTEVPAAIAAQLRELDQPGRPGVRLFDVKTESQVQRMEDVEKDKDLRALISKNKLDEAELRGRSTRRDPRSDFDDPLPDPDDDLDADVAADAAEADASEQAKKGNADDETEFETDPDPDGSKANAEALAEEDGSKDWSSWEADLNTAGDDEVDGPPVPAKRKKATKKTTKKTTKARGGRAQKKS